MRGVKTGIGTIFSDYSGPAGGIPGGARFNIGP